MSYDKKFSEKVFKITSKNKDFILKFTLNKFILPIRDNILIFILSMKNLYFHFDIFRKALKFETILLYIAHDI